MGLRSRAGKRIQDPPVARPRAGERHPVSQALPTHGHGGKTVPRPLQDGRSASTYADPGTCIKCDEGMSTTAVGVLVAFAALGVLALGVALVVRARNSSDIRTRETLRRIGDGVEALTLGLSAIAETAKAETAELGRSVGITLDLEEALRRTAAAAASLPGMHAGAARIVGMDGVITQQTVGISSGHSGLETDFDPPDRSPGPL